jgi:hypothetical protein
MTDIYAVIEPQGDSFSLHIGTEDDPRSEWGFLVNLNDSEWHLSQLFAEREGDLDEVVPFVLEASRRLDTQT